jgi:phosphatidyl-myo-inositol alpha-mannosyltransferase
MKVGMVCPYDWSFPGGVRSHIQGLSEALGRAGIEVQIIAPATRDEPEIFDAGRTLAIPYNGSVARLCLSPQANRRIRKRFAVGDLDLIHIHEPLSPSVSMLAVHQAKVPIVGTFHASQVRSKAYATAKPFLDLLMEKISGRIVVSRSAYNLISTYFPGEYRNIPNGIRMSQFSEAEPATGLAGGRPFVLFVGRPEPRKGLSVAVEAVEKVRESFPIELVTVGPTHKDVPSWVHALGSVSEQELPGIYRAAKVFCAPSLGGESFGIVLAEAAAAGVPVVCSDIPGYVEAAAGMALHAPPGDAGATADQILSVLTDPDRASRMIARGRKRAWQLDWDVLAHQIMEVYEQAATINGPSPPADHK